MIYYISGVAIAFFINFISLIINVMTGTSLKIKNMKKLGGYYSIAEGGLVKEKPSIIKNIFYILDIIIITPLLSWVYVAYFLYNIIKSRINKSPVPEKIKEIKFKLSTAELTKDQVRECLNEISRFYSGQDVDYRLVSDDPYDKDTYTLESADDWDVELDLDKSTHTYTIKARDPDFCEHIDVYEYKFDDQELWIRTVEAKHDYHTKVEYEIKNGVVLEREFRERVKGGIFSTEEDVESRVQQLYRDVEWNQNYGPGIKYFLLFRHADVLADKEAKSFFQSEHERISRGYNCLKEKVASFGCSIGKSKFMHGNTILCDNENISEEDGEKIQEIFNEDGLSEFNLTYSEFNNYERIIDDLELYLKKI